MMTVICHLVPSRLRSAIATSVLGLLLAPFATLAAVEDPLPKGPLPIGQPYLTETRIVKELRPGLTHVHIERGGWGKEGRPKLAFLSVQHDLEGRDKIRACLERAGYTVQEKIEHKALESDPIYILTAGVFDTMEALVAAAREIPCPVQVTNIASNSDIEPTPPRVLDIVVLDPEIYQGKIISAWSEHTWRVSPLELALKRDAVVATNGSFFVYSEGGVAGVPSAISIVEGRWHHEHYPDNKEAGILFIENHADGRTTVSIGYTPPPPPKLKVGGRYIELNGIDRMPKGNEIVAAKRETIWEMWSHGHFPPGVAGRLVRESSSGLDYAILATGDKLEIVEAEDSLMELDLSIPGRPGLNAYYTTPVLIENGELKPTPSWHTERTSRTAIGVDVEGNIYIIVAHLDTSLYESVGVSLSELRDIGVFLGLVNLANLDGGVSSTSMVIEGAVLGDPDMRIWDEVRRVGDSLLIIDDK